MARAEALLRNMIRLYFEEGALKAVERSRCRFLLDEMEMSIRD